jgi:hypothetical protein
VNHVGFCFVTRDFDLDLWQVNFKLCFGILFKPLLVEVFDLPELLAK